MPACEKLERLWDNIMNDTSYGTYPNKVSMLMGLMSESLEPSFTTMGDVFVNGRRKLIHSVGVVGKVVFTPTSIGAVTGYTGCFQGAHYGLIRLSSAVQPEIRLPLTPGFGLKFLRDGRDSANVLAMPSVDGQPDNWNFFAHAFTTTVPDPMRIRNACM